MRKVVIYGAGAYGKMFFYEVARSGAIDIVAFTVDSAYLNMEKECGLPVVPFEEVTKIYPPEEYDMAVLCGHAVMRNRAMMYNKAKAKGYRLINYVSPNAMLENEIKMGDNNIIMANVILGYNGVMGSNNIVHQNTYIGHEFEIENHSVIGTSCTLGGRCHFEDLVFMGMGVTARGYVRYGRESLIGIGSNVVKDVEAYCTCYGNPARVRGYHRDTGVMVNELKREAGYE